MDGTLPHLDTPARPPVADPDDGRWLYIRSYLLMRTVIGLIGVGLPLVLLLGDWFFLAGGMPRASLSAYYHTGMRDIFVGALCVVGVFLITYMAFHYNWDNVLSTTAGVAVLGVAIFPTAGNSPLTPLQERLGERNVSTGHLVCAAVFILCLAAISFLFGRRENGRPDRTAQQRSRGRALHWTCGFTILAAVAYVLITHWLGRFNEHSLFYGETVAVLAFGVSWLAKGLEIRVLLGRAAPTPPAVALAA